MRSYVDRDELWDMFANQATPEDIAVMPFIQLRGQIAEMRSEGDDIPYSNRIIAAHIQIHARNLLIERQIAAREATP